MKKKYELLKDETTQDLNGNTLFRVKALIDFGRVKKGEKGGFVQSEKNLSQDGNAWVCGDAGVCGNARVSIMANISGEAEVDFELPRLTFTTTEEVKEYLKAIEEWVSK